MNARQGEAQALNLNTGGNLYMECSGAKGKYKLNTDGKQEGEHKAHLKQSYSKCLTAWCEDS